MSPDLETFLHVGFYAGLATGLCVALLPFLVLIFLRRFK